MSEARLRGRAALGVSGCHDEYCPLPEASICQGRHAWLRAVPRGRQAPSILEVLEVAFIMLLLHIIKNK